jgi:hypothetical protein
MTLEQLDVLGTWIAGLGTLSAVIVSLYLARSQQKIKLRVTVGERLIVTAGEDHTPEVASILVTNCSPRPAKVTHIAWRIGWRKKRYFIQLFNLREYETLPKMLSEGEEANFIIPYKFSERDEDWDVSMTKSLFDDVRFPRLYAKSLRCCVSTSVGQNFVVKVEKGLRERLLRSVLANKANHATGA